MPSEEKSKIAEMLEAISHGAVRAITWGPGVLGTQAPLNCAGLIAGAVVIYALSGSPYVALGGLAIVVGYLVYANERAYRYAQKDPVSALLGGSELVQMLQHQASAKDKSLVLEGSSTVTGGASNSIEHHQA